MNLIKYILVVLICFSILSCNKDLLDNSSFELSKPILTDSGVVVNWEIPKISDFKYYEILRSIDGRSFQTIMKDSSGIESAKYLDVAYPLGKDVTYRIALFANNIYISNNATISIPKPIELNFHPSNAYIMPEQGRMLFFKGGWNDACAYLFDYNSNTILERLSLPIKTTGYAFGFGKFNNKYEFYFNDGWDFKMHIYDALNLNENASFNFLATYSPVFSVNDKYIVYYDFDYINIVNRETLKWSNFHSTNNQFTKLYYNSVQNKLIGFGNTSKKVVIISIGDSGNIIGEYDYPATVAYDYIEGTNFIYRIENNAIKLVDINKWKEYDLKDKNNNPRGFSLFHYSKDVLYAYTDNTKEIYCYSIDSLRLLKVLPTRVVPRIILSDDNYLFLIESGFSGSMIIDKMKLIK